MGGTTTGAQAADQMQQQAQWAQAAQPDPAPPPAATDPTAAAQPPAANPEAESAAQNPPPAAAPAAATAPVVTSTKRGGLLGVVDDIADVLAGKSRPEVGHDQDGNPYVKQTTLSHGQQWLRIGGEALVGAAKGLAAGRGNNFGAAAGAGVDAGMKMADQRQQAAQDVNDQVDKEKLQQANKLALNMKVADHAWQATRNQVEATQHDVEFAEQQEDRLVNKEGGKYLATAATPADIGNILKVDPNVMENLIKNHVIELMPHYNPDGTRAGIRAYKMPDQSMNKMLPAGSSFHVYDPETGKYVEHKASEQMTLGEQNTYELKAASDAIEFANKKAAIAKTQAETDEANARAKMIPTEGKKNIAEANHANAEAQAARTASTAAGAPVAPLSAYSPAVQQSVRGLTSYQTDPMTFPSRTTAKSGQMDRETAIGLAQQADPSYDEKQFKARNKLLTDFTSGKAAANIRSLNTAIGHLNELAQSAKDLHNGNLQPLNAVENTVGSWMGATAPGKVKKDINAVAGELATLFKGTGATDQEIKSWKDGMSTAQSPEQFRTGIDEALRLMNGRYDALDHQFTAGMGKTRDFSMLSPSSKQILQNLGANEFVQKDQAAAPAPAAPRQQAAQPPAIAPNTPPPAQGMKRIWAPGSPTWKDVPADKVPANVPGLVVQ